jgi:multidrug efflux pump
VNLSGVFIRRPVATTLLMIGLLIAGLLGYRKLPVSALPEVDYPTIVIATMLPGASAETMASAITTPLEKQLGQIPGLEQMTSVSSASNSQITLRFGLDESIDAATQDVQSAINAATNLLPRTLPAPPTYSKSNPADTPILTLSVSSETLPLEKVSDYTDSILAQRISQVSGVGLVTINGGQKPAVRIQVDPQALAGVGLGLDDLRQILVQANVNQPKGNLEGSRQAYTLQADDQVTSAAGYRPLVLAYKDGAPVRLRDVATVIDGVENAELAGWADGHRAVILNVQRQPGANIIEVADKVKALLPQLRSTLPQGVEVRVLGDRTETVRASVEDVEMTLVLTIFLVVLVIFAFLRNWRATIIPGVAVPLSLVGTFGVMYLLGYSLDNLSLMALTISTGFVVDDAIVMVENIARYIEEGKSPFEAALEGAKQIGFTILSLTVSLVAVLIPLLFMEGVIGRLFREFAVTLAVAIGVSAVLSLTLTPMMCAQLLVAEPPAEQRGRFFRLSERFFDGLVGFYDRGLQVVLCHPRTTLAVTIVTVAFTGLLAVWIPKGFFPQQDTGLLLGVTEAAPDVSFARMATLQQAAAEVVGKDPAVASVASFIGPDGTNATTNTGRLSIQLKPRAERADAAEVVLHRLEQGLHEVSGVSVYLQSVQDLQIDARASRTPFQYTLESADDAELAVWAAKMQNRLAKLPELRGVTSDGQTAGRQAALSIDRDAAARLGVSAQAIDDTLYDAFGQRQISTVFTQLNLYRVILEVKPEARRDPRALDHLFVRSTTGAAVPLSAFTRSETKEAPLVKNHQGQFPAVTLSFDMVKGVSLGDAVAKIHAVEREIDLPPSVRGEFQGAAAAFSASLASEPFLILAALVTVYIVLGVLYESYIHPVTILSTLPSAGVGALLALMICGVEFSVIALIGIVLLIGIVKKNAIMMIDFALEAERDEGLSPEAAIHKACLLRFRPIMMTTAAALLGGLPLALGQGTGSELRRPLGISIVGGLIVSQVLTLYTTPVIYLYMDKLAHRFGKTPPPPNEGASPPGPTEHVSPLEPAEG